MCMKYITCMKSCKGIRAYVRAHGAVLLDAMQVPEDLGIDTFVPLDVDERELVLAS